MNHTVFGDLRQRATVVYRVRTRSSEYLVGVHEQRGRKFVIVRGQPGSDREHVVARDSDPRVGEHSLFDLPISEWPGRNLEVATMTSSTIEAVVIENDPIAIAAVGMDGHLSRSPWARPDDHAGSAPAPHLPPPAGMSDTPAIVPQSSRGTMPSDAPPRVPVRAGSQGIAKQVVVAKERATTPAAVEVPYPQRHVGYAESVAQLLRSIARRDRLFEDVAFSRELRDRLRHALDESATLLEQIRRRDRK